MRIRRKRTVISHVFRGHLKATRMVQLTSIPWSVIEAMIGMPNRSDDFLLQINYPGSE